MNRRAFLVTTGFGLFAGCTSDGDESDPSAGTKVPSGDGTDVASGTEQPLTTEPSVDLPLRGVSLSPRSYSDDDFLEFFERVGNTGLAVRWAGNWQDLSADDNAPAVVCNLADQYGYQPIIETGVYSVSQGELFGPLDDDGQAEFVDTVTAFAAEWEPMYFGVGVEVNLHAANQPEEFETFVSLYDDAYEAIKDVSPSTQVYTGFQLEWMRGLRGGIFGGENDPDQAEWDLIDQFPKSDLVAFTTYPDLVFEQPSDIPADYYVEAADRAGKTIALMETGWSPEPKGLGWERTEAQQVEYANRLFELTDAVDVATLVWLWMYDQDVDEPAFENMTLRREDGSARPVWDTWTTGRS